MRPSVADPLTGLPTQEALAEFAVRLPGRALWIDIDSLVWLNDQYGHDAGDRAIRAVADAVRALLDTERQPLFRIGGDEFIALLGDIDEAAALALALRLRDAIDALAIPCRRSDRPEADRLRVNVTTFVVESGMFVERCGGPMSLQRLRDRLADAAYREKLRQGRMAGIVASVVLD